ncbi:MAG: YqgE/AlgH family protein [Microscillaceae bacterium]|jgi:putative transcriptional regulator|nr:YqgE/AlgH family protein [Microscillaceae bacterium]
MTNLKPSAGRLLIAEPFLGDPNFERSVVLMCEHDERGSFGLVLNQTTDFALKDVWDATPYSDIPIYVGGPVQQNSLHFVHRIGHHIRHSIEIKKGLFWSGDFDQVIDMLNLGTIQEEDILFFAGYSGWSGGQLERELSENAWIVTEVEPNFLFDTPANQLWREILKRMGGEYKVKANYPIDPRLN